MKKIAYIELDTHAEIAANFMELMNDSREFSVDYYFSEKILKTLGLNETENIKKANPAQLFHQLSTKNYQLIIIGTVHRYFNVFNQISRKFNTSVIIHNLNFTTISSFQLFKNIFKNDIKYRLKLLLKEGLLSATEVYKKARNLLVLDESLVQKNSDFTLKFLPVFFNNDYSANRKSIQTIVIPGTVSQARRDYLHLLEKIKTFKRNTPCRFIFLGKADGKELSWLKEFEKTKPENISIQYFTEKVPLQIFDDWMQKADILWCPIQSETEFFSQKEFYGKTKMSGNIGDAIKYGKLAIFPENYPNSHPFIIPESKDLEEQIFNDQKLMNYDFEENFAREKVRKNLEQKLLTLL
ncbi:hypothetical protein AP75_08510 [Kaistella haifensis DSM 19056]|uniref:Glycosyl transferase family 1 domain-containing protein n=1 Tax=Kaistella haifensis DSM 19056 TaxID=1450526 RepID=A0A246B9P1_9FLAO|nr:hypothetical protein [Kaistella haifensis]OWK97899.1 hypothetical protein AP75_08510 [Kaistella haifensis DSM 19056]